MSGMDSIIQNLKSVFIEPPCQPESVEDSAAVLIVLGEVKGECCVLLNKRSENLRRHPGQVCFPGGMREPSDVTVVETALRECEEEIGLSRDLITVISVMPTVRIYQKSLPLTPVICTVPPDTMTTYNFTLNSEEVATNFYVPLLTFLSLTSSSTALSKDSPSDDSPEFIATDRQSAQLLSHVVETSDVFDMHHFNVLFEGTEFDVRGITAHLCIFVAVLGLGKKPSFQYRIPTQYCVFDNGVKQEVGKVLE